MSLKSLEDKDKEYRKKLEEECEREVGMLKKVRDIDVEVLRKEKENEIEGRKNKAEKKQLRRNKEIEVEKIRAKVNQEIENLIKKYAVQANRYQKEIDELHVYMRQELWQIFWNKYWVIVGVKYKYEFFNTKKWLDIFRKKPEFLLFGLLTNHDKFTTDEAIQLRYSNDKYNGFYLTLMADQKVIIKVQYDMYDTTIEYNAPPIEKEYINNRISHFQSHQQEIISKIDKLCRYIYNYYLVLYNTPYLALLPKARTFYLSSRATFPKDISKLIYKKILFFYFLFFILFYFFTFCFLFLLYFFTFCFLFYFIFLLFVFSF